MTKWRSSSGWSIFRTEGGLREDLEWWKLLDDRSILGMKSDFSVGQIGSRRIWVTEFLTA